MESESKDTILTIEEPQRDLTDEETALNEQTWTRVCEQLQAVIPHLNVEVMQVAFWQLAQSMSYTHSLPYLEATENVVSAVRNGDYARCFYSAIDGAVLARYHGPMTFLVDTRADFIYTHIIDQLLLQEYENADVITQAATDRYERRARFYKPCPLEGSPTHQNGEDKRVCPLCWVVYTRIDSAFYKQARARLNGSMTVNFSESIYDYMDVEHLSFQLVLFMCGSQIVADEADSNLSHYDAVNQWVKVPVWWLLLQ